jgi:hypothetical protein
MDAENRDDHPELEPPILQGLGQSVTQIEPPAGLRGRVLAAAPGKRIVVHDRHAPAASLAWLAAAALLAVAVGMVVYASQLRGRIAVLEAELRDAREQVQLSQRQIADARTVAAGAQSAVAVLTAPDVARVDLAGQQIAPGASGRAFWSRSRGMVFNASNLPQLPAGRVYQLWVIPNGAPISAGLLTPDAQGSISEMIQTPPTIPQPVAMAVTIEPAGGVPAPTGDKYLVGTL